MITQLAQNAAPVTVPPEVWIMGGIAVLVLCTCAGIALIMRAWFSRPNRPEPPIVKRPNILQEGESDGARLVNQLNDIRTRRFAPPIRPVTLDEPTNDFEPREPEDYKGPFRRGTEIRRTAKKRRYYNRRQDPEMFGRRGQPKEEEKDKEDGTTTRKKGR